MNAGPAEATGERAGFPPRPAGAWTGGKLLWFAVACTAVQLLVVVRLGRVPKTVRGSLGEAYRSGWAWDSSSSSAVLAGGFGAHPDAFADDPTDPFQSVARSALPRPTYRFAEWTAPARWLTNPPTVPGVTAVPATIATRPAEGVRPTLPTRPTLPIVADRTAVAVEGPMAARAWDKAPEIGTWDGVELLGSTRVEILVNPQGWIHVARVVESSGLRAADEAARRAVLEARLRALPGAPRRPGFGPGDLTGGIVTVRWSTRTTLR